LYVIKQIATIKNIECETIEYKFSNNIISLLKPAPGYAKNIIPHNIETILAKL
jgi:hypothetical protein